jgi:multiple sugar transport system substrate-binding protein
VKRRAVRLRAAAAALVAAVVLAACTKAPQDDRFAGVNAELTLMICGAPDEVQTVRHYVQKFRERTPGVTVKIQHAPDMGFSEKLNARFVGDDPPDVFYLNVEDFSGFASRGWLLPLDDLVEADRKAGTFASDAYFKNVFDEFRYEGQLYGIVKDFAKIVL